MTLVSLYKSIFEPITKGGSDKFHFLVPALVCIGRLMQQKQEREITEPAWCQISAAAPRQSFFCQLPSSTFINFPNPLFSTFSPSCIYSQGYPPSSPPGWVKRVHISTQRLCGNNLVLFCLSSKVLVHVECFLEVSSALRKHTYNIRGLHTCKLTTQDHAMCIVHGR